MVEIRPPKDCAQLACGIILGQLDAPSTLPMWVSSLETMDLRSTFRADV